jgi:hypothetical protein
MLLTAVRWPSWRVPALAFGCAHWALHALSHIVDTHHRDGTTVGLLEFAGLARGTALLAVALRRTMFDATRRRRCRAGGGDIAAHHAAEVGADALARLRTRAGHLGPQRAQPGRRGQRAGVRRIVAESVIFAYGFASSVPPSIDESTPHFGAAPRGGSEMLAAIRAMEQTVLSSGEYSDMEGILLRYDALRRRCAAHRDDDAPRQVVGASGADG